MLMLFKQRSLMAALFVFVFSMLAYSPESACQTAPIGPSLPVKTLGAGMHRIQAEVAATDVSQRACT